MPTKKNKSGKSTKAPARTTQKRIVTKKSDFWTVEFNVNSVYWMVIGLAVISTAVLTYNTNQQINEIYDSVDATITQSESPYITTKPKATVPATP